MNWLLPSLDIQSPKRDASGLLRGVDSHDALHSSLIVDVRCVTLAIVGLVESTGATLCVTMNPSIEPD